MRPDRLRRLNVSIVSAAPHTTWIFLEAETQSGLRGVGEATLAGQDEVVLAALPALSELAFGLHHVGSAGRGWPLDEALPAAAASSALDQAMWDIAARRRGVSVAAALGGVRRTHVAAYANINRRTRDRSPAAFASSARAAIGAGHRAIKLAPFDEISTDSSPTLLAPGIERVAAVRDAAGTAITLMVDCHWRLNPANAFHAIDAIAELGCTWLECPLPERAETVPSIVAVRRYANSRGMVLAGMETGIGVDAFKPYLDAGAYDVMMPDIKYVGSYREALRLGHILNGAGVAISPHNPSGPIAHAASLQLAAALPQVAMLEVQFDETPLFDAVTDNVFSQPSDGVLRIPDGPGIGATLNREALTRARVRHLTLERNA